MNIPDEAVEAVHESDCEHLSMTGDEGPIELMGRFPKRWRCDACTAVFHESEHGLVNEHATEAGYRDHSAWCTTCADTSEEANK